MSSIQQFLAGLFSQGSALNTVFLVPLFLILGDFASGVLSAVKNKQFDWNQLADVLGRDSDLVKYVIGQLVLAFSSNLLSWGVDTKTIVATLGSLVLSLSTFSSVVSNINELLPAGVRPLAQELEADVAGAVGSVAKGQVPSLPTAKMPSVSAPVQPQGQPLSQSQSELSPWSLPPRPQ